MGLTKSRSANGQFPKGQSGNPGGRPRDEQKVAELARTYTDEPGLGIDPDLTEIDRYRVH